MGPDPIALFLLISALIAATGFMGMYATYSPWRSNEVGRSMMLLAFSIALMLVTGLLLQALGPDYPFRALFRNLVYLVLNVSMWWQLCLLIRVQNRNYRDREAERTQDAPAAIPAPRATTEAQDNELVD